MDAFKELWDAFKGQLVDRMSNPFTGAFAIAWAAWNIRLLVVLVWIEPYRDKFKFIDETLYPNAWYWLTKGILLPAATAFAYLFGYAWLTTRAATHYREQQSLANNLMRKAAGEALMTPDEHRAAQLRIAQEVAAIREERTKMGEESSRQADLIAQQRVTIGELEARFAELEGTYSKLVSKQAKAENLTEEDDEHSVPSLPVSHKAVALLDALATHKPGPDRSFALSRLEVADSPTSEDSNIQNPSPRVSYPGVYGPPEPSIQNVSESREKLKLLVALSESAELKETRFLCSEIGEPYAVTLHHLEALSDIGLVNFRYENHDTEMWWSLTKEGRAFVVKMDLMGI